MYDMQRIAAGGPAPVAAQTAGADGCPQITDYSACYAKQSGSPLPCNKKVLIANSGGLWPHPFGYYKRWQRLGYEFEQINLGGSGIMYRIKPLWCCYEESTRIWEKRPLSLSSGLSIVEPQVLSAPRLAESLHWGIIRYLFEYSSNE